MGLCQLRVHDLNGDGASQTLVNSLIHRGHAAIGDSADDSVPAFDDLASGACWASLMANRYDSFFKKRFATKMCSLVVYKEWFAEDAMNTGLSQCGGISLFPHNRYETCACFGKHVFAILR